MSVANIVLWTISLVLSVSSISFAVLATYFSSKANQRIKATISAEWIINATTKHFFDNMKDIQKINVEIIKKLSSTISYNEYVHIAKHTRFAIISSTSQDIIKGTKYSEILTYYTEAKKELQHRFASILNFKLLTSTENMPTMTKKDLTEYHRLIQTKSREILSMFAEVSNREK